MEFQALTDRKLEISGGFVRRELREQDLLRRLEEYSGENSDCTVDCTLSLGFSSSASSESSEKIQQRGVDLKSDFWTKIDKKRCGHFQVGENYRVVNGYRWGNGGSNYMSLLPDIVNFGSKRDGFSFFGASSIAIADNSSICRNYMRVSNAPVNRILHKMGKNGTEITSTRKCSTCETTTTPLWRNGPKGTKSLCNACGIRFKKEERRAMGSSDSWMKRKGDGDEGREQERSKIPKI